MSSLLNPYVDVVKSRRQYRDFNWARLEDLFEKGFAEKLLQELVKKTSFENLFDINGEVVSMSDAQLAALSAEQRNQLFEGIQISASKGEGQLYSKAKIDFESSRFNNPVSWSVLEWLNSAAMLELVSDVTGKSDLSYAVCDVVRLTKGHFLGGPALDNKDKKICFIIDLIPEWKLNWGGLLHLHSVYDGCGVTFTPEFNSMVLFDASFDYSITYLANYIKYNRYSLLGYFSLS